MTKRQIKDWLWQRGYQKRLYYAFIAGLDRRRLTENFMAIHEKGVRYAKLCLSNECGGVDCLCSSLNRAKRKARKSALVVRRSTGTFW